LTKCSRPKATDMHELSICGALIAQVEAIAAERSAYVRQVRVGVGPLSGVEPQLLAFAYPVACAGTRAEGSHLEIERTAIVVRCRSCGAQSPAAPSDLGCTACGAWATDLVSGDELLLLQVEIETNDEQTEPADV
jgi:hydrogenase nickel incorporation protein HypA/HybF